MSLPPFTPDALGALGPLLKVLDEGIIVVDARGRFVFANEAMPRIMGLPSVEAVHARTHQDLLGSVDVFDARGAPVRPQDLPSRQAFAGQEPPPRELLFLNRTTGAEIWTVVSAAPLRGPSGAIEHVALIFRDLTAQRRTARILRFLAEASATLSASLDYLTTLKVVLRLAVPELADMCSLQLLEEDGSWVTEVTHADPAMEEVARQGSRTFQLKRPPLREDSMKTGQLRLIPSVTDDFLQAMAVNAEHLAHLRTLHPKALLSVPLMARGRVLGTLDLALTDTRRRFDDERLSLASELGARAALAVDNARLYREAQAAFRRKDEEARINDALQRLGTSFASQLDPDRLLQLVTEETTRLTGARFGAFFRAGAEASRPPASAGTPPDAAGLMPAAWLAALLRPSHGPPASLRCDDVTAHPCPPGAPAPPEVIAEPLALRSLLVVPVLSRSGEVLGGLLLGHSRAAAFTPEHERAVGSIAAQAAVALDNARFVQDLRAAQERLRESEDRLHLAISAGRMGYYDYDLATKSATFSPRLSELLGGGAGGAEPTWDSFNQAVHPEDGPWVEGRMATLLESAADTDSFELRVIWPDGSVHWLDRFNKVVRDAEGRPRRLVGILQEATDRHQAQEKLERLLKELVRSNTELEQFAYVASHDLQQPLRMISSYTQLLARRYQGKLDSTADEFIHYVVDGAARMKQLISELLTYSRAGSATKPLVPVSCQEIVSRTLVDLETAIIESGGQVTSDPLPAVMGDEVQLGQLFQNLIGNALKFRGTGAPRVHVSARRQDDAWLFSVQDNGIGIDPRDFQRIFIIFQRLHDDAQYSGSGLGLAICKKIVERHGGRIWVESKPGQGTTFLFSLMPVQDDARRTA